MAQAKKKFTLKEIENRVNDVFKNHSPEDIERNQPVRIGLGIFLEMRWLVDQLKKAQGEKVEEEELEAAGV